MTAAILSHKSANAGVRHLIANEYPGGEKIDCLIIALNLVKEWNPYSIVAAESPTISGGAGPQLPGTSRRS